jgi:hypothetical protein
MVVSSIISLGRIVTRNSVLSAERTQAYNLAQQSIEIVREMRDTIWIDEVKQTDWAEWNYDVPSTIDPTTICHEESAGLGCYAKFIDIDNRWRLVAINSLDPSDPLELEKTISEVTYQRQIFVDEFSPPDSTMPENYRQVKVRVTWTEYGQDYNVEIATFLTNWHPTY